MWLTLNALAGSRLSPSACRSRCCRPTPALALEVPGAVEAPTKPLDAPTKPLELRLEDEV